MTGRRGGVASWSPFWADGFVYDSTVGTGVWVGLREWFFGEHVLWNGDPPASSSQRASKSSETEAGRFHITAPTVKKNGPFGGVPPSLAEIRICDSSDGARARCRPCGGGGTCGGGGGGGGALRIETNWMMLDVAKQVDSGRRVLPPPPA